MFNSVVVHYAELSTKGENKGRFINQLVRNIKSVLNVDIETFYGRQVINLNDDSKLDEIKEKLSNVFGISNFAFAIRTINDIEEIKKTAEKLFQD
ncbi:MAG: tRNA 4-thiouridine(8) synthase ThiI, partial [Nanoarchaeota archaeon]